MAALKRALAFSAVATGAAGMTCPGSGSWVHASMEVTATASATCADVAAEIQARASGHSGWTDPHNEGTYSLVKATTNEIRTQRTANPAKSVGGKKYVDKQVFTLTDVGGHCKIEACSESQGMSVKDFSTNYCDIRNLYCGSADGCTAVSKDFATSEESHSPSVAAGHDFSMCITKVLPSTPAFLAATGDMTCPGSGSWVRAWIEVKATATASCADVAAEIQARASGQHGWKDPHNGGIYSFDTASSTEIRTRRTADPEKSVGHQAYIDKQVFTLTQDGNSCQIAACSESQGFSVGDFSTNYCDIRNLYCGTADGCSPVSKDFVTSETSSTTSVGAGHDFSKCIVKPSTAEVVL